MFLLLTNQEAVSVRCRSICATILRLHSLLDGVALDLLYHACARPLLLLPQFNWSVLNHRLHVRSAAIQRLINQCVLNYPKILRFSHFYRLQVGCSDCIFIASLSHSLSHSLSPFAMQRHSIYLLVAGKTIIVIRALTASKRTSFVCAQKKTMGFSILLFLLCESKLPPRCNRFSFVFFYYWKNRNYRFLRIRLHLWQNEMDGNKVEMDVKLRRYAYKRTKNERKKKTDVEFSTLVNHKLHFNNEWPNNSSVNLTSHQFWLRWPPRLSVRWRQEQEEEKKNPYFFFRSMRTNVAVENTNKSGRKDIERNSIELLAAIISDAIAYFTAGQRGHTQINRNHRNFSLFIFHIFRSQSASHVFGAVSCGAQTYRMHTARR